jgi:hypothetical protein
MASAFGATSTTDDVLSGVNLRGERILVTGASAGLGRGDRQHKDGWGSGSWLYRRAIRREGKRNGLTSD